MNSQSTLITFGKIQCDYVVVFKGELYPKLKFSMIWTLSQIYEHFFWGGMIWLSWSKLSEKLKNDMKILIGQAVHELLIKA